MKIEQMVLFRWSLLSLLLLYSLNGLCVPSEGLNQWGILKSKATLPFELSLSEQQSYWSSNYQSASIVSGYSSKQAHMFLVGYQAATQSLDNQREAWFLKYESLFGTDNSVGFKYLHQNWMFLGTGIESLGLSYNTKTNIGYYHSWGYYFRWTKQQWDPYPNRAFNFDTDDGDGFFIVNAGWYFELNSGTLTVDVNNRDYFAYYNSDNWALDFKYYIGKNSSFTVTTTLSLRFTGIFGLAVYPGSGYFSFGIEY